LWVAQAGTVHGVVKNGTTGKTAAGIEVILIQLQGGMQPVANTKSNAQGEFSFDNAGIGAQPMLIRAVYDGVNFHQPLPPGKTDVSVEVFDSTKDNKTITIPSRIVFFQPNGTTLTVGEEDSIENKSQPPKAYFRADGNFEFSIPQDAQLQQVAAAGPAGMPVVQAPIDKNKGNYAIAFAFRPGESTVRYSYEIPYPENAASVKVPINYSIGRLIVVIPPTMTVTGGDLQPGGQEQGMNIFGRENVSAGTLIALNVSGTAPPLRSDGNSGADPQGRDAQQADTTANIQVVPGRYDYAKYGVLIVCTVFFGGLAYTLWRKKVVVVTVGAPLDSEEVPPAEPKKQPVSPSGSSFVSPAAPSEPAPTSLAAIDAAVGNSLDALKETIFRLELRRQAGTITEEEYAQERARTEKMLRDLVRG
jgi:hypothetical protein